MGECDGVFFDWFVREYELPMVFDRDRWTEWSIGMSAVVSSMPLSIPWAAVSSALDRVPRHDIVGPAGIVSRSADVSDRIFAVDWGRTRVARQDGGFLKPRFIWDALVPERYDIWSSPDDARPASGMVTALGRSEDEFGAAWPRAVPSAALKRRLVGVENLRHRDGCEAFYFRHGQARVTGLYRRDLWPEPSEDPLYAVLWNLATTHQLVSYFRPKEKPELIAVDDLEQGLLDRGYRVAGQRQTMNARELDDLMRGQLEDAREATANDQRASEEDWLRLAAGLDFAGRSSEALQAAERAIQGGSASHKALLTVAQLLKKQGLDDRARSLVLLAAELAPNDPAVLVNISELDFARGDYASAATRVDRALAHFDPVELPSTPWSRAGPSLPACWMTTKP